MSYLEAVKRERRRLSILGTLFVVGTVAWVIGEGWTSTGGLLSFSLFVFGTVASLPSASPIDAHSSAARGEQEIL